MITTYLALYLFFIIVAALVISLLVIKLKLPSPRLVIGLILFFILSPLVAGYLYIAYFDALPETVVPDVTGLTYEMAKEKLDANSLEARLAGSVNEMKYLEGQVASQRPEAGRKVKSGRVVNLMVSAGKRKVSVPNLLGRPIEQAEAVLSAAELMLGEVKREQSRDAREGAILAQEPLPGEEIEVGTKVDLLIAASPEVESEPEKKEEGGFRLWW